MQTVADVMTALQGIAPLSLAAEWDNVGLLLGDPKARVQRVMTCLTVTPATAAEAIETNTQLIVTHHPILFRPTKKLTTASAEGRMVLHLAQAGVAVYSPHTAFDNSLDGINQLLARNLGLTEIAPLQRVDAVRSCKIVAFMPDKDLQSVSDALFATGAGVIGQYRECSYRVTGTGTFFGTEDANPTIGIKGRREDVVEWRLEVKCPETLVDQAIRALRSAHSYEEPAYDVYPLRAEPAKIGAGRVGTLPAPTTLGAFAHQVKTVLKASQVQVVGSSQQSVQRVALACGAAGEFLKDAIAQKADVFLTGEMRFHDCLAAEAQQIAVVLPGHYATERIGIEWLAERLQSEFADLAIHASERERDPISMG
jgi:dinuclear metal center YbgI/SA1388 family protein